MMKIKSVFSWFKKDKKRFIAGLAILFVLLFVIFRSRASDQTAQLQTAKVERGNIVSTITGSGSILSSNLIPVTTGATGVVNKIYVKDGDKVFKGQKIMDIELDSAGQMSHASSLASYLSAKNNLDVANSTSYSLQSAEFAANQKFINDAVARNLSTDDPTYIQQYADWKAAEAKFIQQSSVQSAARASLSSSYLFYLSSSSVVVAPIGGTIINITYTPGMNISGTSGARVAVVTSVHSPIATFNISEVDVSKVNIGMKATVTLDSLTDKTFTGKVVSVDKIGNTTSGVTSYPVVIQFDTTSPDVLPNMAAAANIILATKDNILLVPSSAITTSGGQSTVRVSRAGREEIVTVETGLSSDTSTEIVSGVNEGDEIITGTVSTTSTTTGRSVFGGGVGGFGGNVRISR